MTHSGDYIEVVTSTTVTRKIECYRATIDITVATRKSRSCMQVSLAVRDRVLAGLSDAGLAAAEIEEGAGSLIRQSWTTWTRFSQSLVVRHSQVPTLMQAMANIEQVFASFDDGWLSGIRRDYSVGTPTPEYRDDPSAGASTLQAATYCARLKAEHLAAGVQCRIGEVSSIVEIASLPRVSRSQSPTFTESSLDFDAVEGFADFKPRRVGYAAASMPKGHETRSFRVRFRILPDAPRGGSAVSE